MAAPSTPTGLSTVHSYSNYIAVTWHDVANEDGYYIYRSLDDVTYVKVGTVGVDVQSYHDINVEADTQYYYKVSAYNGDGESALTSSVTKTTLAKSFRSVYIGSLGPTLYDANAINSDLANDKRGLNTGGSIYSYKVLVGILASGGVYFGGEETANSWRIVRLANDLVVQRYESSVWVTKHTFTP